MYLGTSAVDTFKLGSDQVDKIYLGADEVWVDVIPYLACEFTLDGNTSFMIGGANGYYTVDDGPAISIKEYVAVSISGTPSEIIKVYSGCTSFSFNGGTTQSRNVLTCTIDAFYLTSLKVPGEVAYDTGVAHLDRMTSYELKNSANIADMYWMFGGCAALTCIGGILDTTKATDRSNMFVSCSALTRPDAAAQTDLQDGDGAVWTNPNPCPAS